MKTKLENVIKLFNQKSNKILIIYFLQIHFFITK
jgi:hypothetical protein